ncbi:sigma-E processing peptidase SpoIIGA [Mangrovibacillus cuniculi]|uniref:Sigma-E processing peptidase SpoIIGA n=1 Tax=Mangrovibacillus cuniculi TaxID=2593652 RepID=A0A7S8HFB6_9BACI|nr:sigma-E processing peptidase SpoIIGA [Mangrovibacillus cuniculi]QPC46265.1 sigma-E processing peptidase SpoIIGA [Mangrovibacillus cuniculi]
MTIYADAIWVLNFGMDSLLLWMTARFLKRKIGVLRILLGGFIGSSIVLFSFFPSLDWTQSIPSKIALSFLMILATFGRSRIKTFLKRLFTFYLATFLAGGALLGIHYLITFELSFQAAYHLANQKGFGDPVSWLFIILVLPLVWFFSTGTVRTLETTKIQHDQKFTVSLSLGEFHWKGTGLLDTGNKACDPVSGTPVIVVSIKDSKELFPKEFVHWVSQEDEQLHHLEELSDSLKDKIRMIPATSLGRQNQLLIGFKADEVEILSEKEYMRAKRVLLVFTMRSLSADKEFDVILHQKMFQEAQVISETEMIATLS